MYIACVACDYPEPYPLRLFAMDVGELMIYLLPVAIGVVLWKVFITNRTIPRGNIVALGLDETTATDVELYGRSIQWRTLGLRILVGALTFQVGVFAVKSHWYVQGLLRLVKW
jgi:hypothetical protein